MRCIAVHGADAAKAAAGLILSLRAAGGSVTAAYAGAEAPDAGFVTAEGRFLPDDVFWLEWASGRAVRCGVPSAPETETVVLAAPDPTCLPGERFERVAAADLPIPPIMRGDFTTGSGVRERPVLRIGVVGDPHRHRHVSPAVLARLRDAAERAGLAVEPVFIAGKPKPEGLCGMVLPGGADMAQFGLQIAMADRCFAQGIPTFGLCLGMQSMLTSRVRAMIWPEAASEEIVGPGSHRSFVRLRAADGSAFHRHGERRFEPVCGTGLAKLLPQGAAIRMNHRYRFNPEIDQSLLPGIVLHRSDDIVDAIEVPAHPFFVGLQGHPELGCDPALTGLWDGFIQATSKFQAGQSR